MHVPDILASLKNYTFTYSSSEHVSGLSMRYPVFRRLYSSLLLIPGYGFPPVKRMFLKYDYFGKYRNAGRAVALSGMVQGTHLYTWHGSREIK